MTSPHFVERSACPVCGGRSWTELYRCDYLAAPVRDYLEAFYAPVGAIEWPYLEGAAYVLVACRDCGLVFQRQIPGDALMVRLYEHWIDPRRNLDYYARRDVTPQVALHFQEILGAIGYLGKRPGELFFLDFGMGWGNWCRLAQVCGCRAAGSELSQARLDYARARGVPVVSWDEIPDLRCDLVNLEQVLEHVAEPLAILQHVTRALEPGGLVKIGVPDGGDLARRLRLMDWSAPKGSRRSLNAVSPLEHINCFSHAALVRLGARAGLEPVQIPLRLQYAYTVPGPALVPALKNLVRPLRRRLRPGTTLFFRRRAAPG